MAKLQTEKANVQVIIDGKPALNTIKELEQAERQLVAQMKNLNTESEEFKAAMGRLGDVRGKLQPLRDELKNVGREMKDIDGASQKFGDRITKLEGGSGVFSNMKNKITEVKESVMGATNGLSGMQMGVFGVVGAVAALVGFSLYSYFTKTDEGATKLEGILGGLRAAVDTLLSGFVSLGEWIVKAFENPKQALNDLLDFVKGQVVNRFNAIGEYFAGVWKVMSGDFKEGLTEMNNSMLKFSTGIDDPLGKLDKFAQKVKEAAAAAFELAVEMDALEDAERSYSVTQEKTKNTIDALLLSTKNKNITLDQGLKLLREASKLEEADYNQRVKFANENLRLAQKQNEIDAKAGKDTDEMAQRETDALIAIEKLKGESILLREKIANRESQFILKIQKEREAETAHQKEQLDKQNKELEDAKKRAMDIEDRMTNAEINLIADKNEQKRLKILASYDKQLTDLQEKGLAESELYKLLQQNLDKELADLKLASIDENIKKELTAEELAFEIKKAAKNLEYSTIANSEAEFQNEIYNLKLNSLTAELQLLTTAYGAESDIVKKKEIEITNLKAEENRKRTAGEKKHADDRAKIRDTELKSAKSLTTGLMGLMTDVLGESAKATKAYKLIASADVILNSAMEIQRIFASYSTLGPVGQGLAIGQAAVAAARTAIQINRINSVNPNAKMGARGMIVGGDAHGSSYGAAGVGMFNRRTGQEIGEIEGGEIVLPKAVTYSSAGRQAASQLSQAFGGVAFADGGIVPGGGGGQNNMSFASAEQMSEMIALQKQQLQLTMLQKTTLKAEVSLSEFDDQNILRDKVKSKMNA